MDIIIRWFETTPSAVFVVVIGFFVLLGLLSWLGKKMSGMKASGLFKAVKILNLDILSSSSGLQGSIPRIAGFYKGRNLEICEYDKTQWGKTVCFTRFKLSHKTDVTRKIEFVHIPGEFPPVKELKLDGENIDTARLLKFNAFNERIIDDIGNFLSEFSSGQVKQNTILTIDVKESSYDRDITQIGDENKIVSCLEGFDRILVNMEEFEKSKKVRKQ